MTDDRIVLCMKWGTLYSSDYVNVLYNACRRAISGQFRFVCLTDDATGFDPGIETFPIPEIGLKQEEWFTPGVWPKLALYAADLHGLKGRCLFIDLDMMVVGGLDEMFDTGAQYIGINVGQSWRPGRVDLRDPELGTGVFAFTLGDQVQILEAFQHDIPTARADHRNEQEFVAAHAKGLEFWPPGWVISFKRWLRRPIGIDLFLSPKKPPSGTRIVAFHGDPRPIAMIPSNVGFWDSFPHLGRGQVAWARDYWVDNAGRLPPISQE